MSPQLDRTASGTIVDGKSVGRGTGCANVRTSGSAGAPGRQRPGATQPDPSKELQPKCFGRIDR
jgi:hypothetical protein